jgi:hypothetical protein
VGLGIRRQDVRDALVVWAVWLVAVLAFVALCVSVGLIPSGPAERGMPGVTRIGTLWPLRSWDFARYARIAVEGYPGGPGGAGERVLPALAGDPGRRSAARAHVGRRRAGGLGRSRRRLRGRRGARPGRRRRRTAITLALMPGSFSLALAYPDGLALAAAVWACALAQRGPAAPGRAAGAHPSLARPNGFLLAVPLFLIARRRGSRSGLVAAAAPVVGSAAVHLYLWARTDDPLAFTHAQRYWDRGGPWMLPWSLVRVLWTGHLQTVAEAAVAALVLWLCVLLFRRGAAYRPWAWYAAAVLALSLGSGSFQSIPRQSLFAFPLIWMAAARPGWLADRRVLAGAVAVNAGLILALPLMPP